MKLKLSVLGVMLFAILPVHAGELTPWTLTESVRRAVFMSPELRAAEAEIEARVGVLEQSDAWPNPTMELRTDEKLGLEDGRGGYNLNQLSITQSIPLQRLSHQRRASEAALESARSAHAYQSLMLEAKTAQAFHTFQLAAGRTHLADERVSFVEDMQYGLGQLGKDRLVRYLSPLEKARLEIMRASAHQAADKAEGELNEALVQFRTLLDLPPNEKIETTHLIPAEPPTELSKLFMQLDVHPAIQALRFQRDARRDGVEVAKAGRFADPTLTIFHELDYLGGSRRGYTGLMLGIQLPLWTQNDGDVARARGEAVKADALIEEQQRDLSSHQQHSHMHLGHLIEQAQYYRAKLLQPAFELLELTRKGYKSGEQNGLELVDSSNTYFDAQARYLELLHEAWLTAADLRLASGISLLNNSIGFEP